MVPTSPPPGCWICLTLPVYTYTYVYIPTKDFREALKVDVKVGRYGLSVGFLALWIYVYLSRHKQKEERTKFL